MSRLAVAAAALALAAAAPGSPFTAEEPNVREGNERLLAGDPGSALLRYEAAERAVGPRPELDFDRGNALFRAGQAAAARAAWARAAARGPAPLASRAQQNLGTALAAGGDREGAITALSQALRLDPGNEDARVNLEILLRRREAEHRDAQQQRRAPPRGERGPGRPEAETRSDTAPPRDRDGPARPLRREDAERLLDALRAREQPMPLPGSQRRAEGGSDADRDW